MATLEYENEKAEFLLFYDSSRGLLDGALGSFRTLVRSLLASRPEVATSDIEGRVKDREECINKFNLKYRGKLESEKTPYAIRDHITDLIGLRVVCLYEDDVERVGEIMSDHFDVISVTDKIAQMEDTEGSFGYKGLHLDLRLNEVRSSMPEYSIYSGYRFELQIRTIAQDAWSVIDHKIKYKKSIPNSLKRRINTLAALFELVDREFRAIRDATALEIEKTAPYDETETENKLNEGVADEKGLKVVDVESRRYAPLNAFNFLKIARHFFPEFEFEAHKVDGFTQEIVSLKSDMSRGKFNYYMRENISDVKKYQTKYEDENEGKSMNAFTVMRHCLYAGDKKIFSSMLTDKARSSFDDWILANSDGQN